MLFWIRSSTFKRLNVGSCLQTPFIQLINLPTNAEYFYNINFKTIGCVNFVQVKSNCKNLKAINFEATLFNKGTRHVIFEKCYY